VHSSAVVVSGTAAKRFSRSEGSKDGPVPAGSEVDDLLDLVHLIAFMAVLVESLGPWQFALLLLNKELKLKCDTGIHFKIAGSK
jgi:hypothetical protein